MREDLRSIGRDLLPNVGHQLTEAIDGALYSASLRFAAAALAVATLCPATGHAAATPVTLYNFCAKAACLDGSQPFGGVIGDATGNLYGTTLHGGLPGGPNNGAYGEGTVFAVTPEGTETVLHSFNSYGDSHDGLGAWYGLIIDRKGNLFGTTLSGGETSLGSGWGTVFEIPAGGKEQTIYQFCGLAECTDGHSPAGPVIMDAAGNLYGTTGLHGIGGAQNGGVVFELSPNAARTGWKQTALFTFPPNVSPSAGLVMDASGDLFGTTGSRHGTVFELRHTGGDSWKEQTIYAFCRQPQCADGANPLGGLILDAAGDLYGTTENGGDQFNDGTVFELIPNAAGGPWTEKVLYRFCAQNNCTDGDTPQAGLLMDRAGNLYGTTFYGGTGGVAGVGAGTVFELRPNGAETVLYSFCSEKNCADGRNPSAGLIRDRLGRLYGTTSAGGTHYNPTPGNYAGTVFVLTP